MSEIRSVTLIGAGRLAWQMGMALTVRGLRINQVYNRTRERGEALAIKLNAGYTDDLSLLRPADVYIIAVSDAAIEQIISNIRDVSKLYVHTSGTIDLHVFPGEFKHCGVFYPLQTFSFHQPIRFDDIPVCIEANTGADAERLIQLAQMLSGNVHRIDSRQRRYLHLAAVFACNFPNFLYAVSSGILKQCGLGMEMLEPLIRQTNMIPADHDFFARQTGPAIREDISVMEKHREMLAAEPKFLELYNLISENIISYKKKNGQL